MSLMMDKSMKRRTVEAMILACITVPWLAPVSAQDLPRDMLSCSAVKDGIKRLECFDRLAMLIQGAADVQAKIELSQSNSSFENWRVTVSQSKIDDSKSVVLATVSNETVPGRFNRTAKPGLILRCLQNTTSAYINFDGLHMADIRGYGRVTFRVDKRKAFTRTTDVSTDNSSLGFWNGGSSIPFIKQLFGGSTLLVQATPFGKSPVTFSLDISGLEESIKPLRTACNW